jgi:hypothetical protein
LQIEDQGLQVQECLRGVSNEPEIYHDGGIPSLFSELDRPSAQPEFGFRNSHPPIRSCTLRADF